MSKKQTMYLETSVISAYFDFWKSNPQQKRDTRLFWLSVIPKFKVYVSDVNFTEIKETKKQEWREQMEKLTLPIEKLSLSAEMRKLAQKYVNNGVMPPFKINDALHLAVAVLNKMDYFTTWNFRHLSRPHQKRKIFEFNQAYKLYIPIIIEPTELIKELSV